MTDGPFPKLDTPFVQPSRSGEPAESGRIIAVPWYRLLITFWNRTGGSLGGVLLAQDNLDDVDSAVTSADNLSTESLAIASAATTDLSLSTGVNVLVTGNANISSFGIVSAGAHRTVRFSGSPTLVNSASLILQGGSNTSVSPGDIGEFVSEGLGNWRQISWLPFARTGAGAEVYATSPALTTPNIGVATATSIKVGGGATVGIIDFGTYTPTLFNTTNLDASTPFLTAWYRIGNIVTVFGTVAVDPTAAAATVLGMSIPVASVFTNAVQAGGTAASVSNEAWSVISDAVNNRVSFNAIAVGIANHNLSFQFSYRVL